MARNNIKNPWNAVGFTCHYHARLIERSGSKQAEWIKTRGVDQNKRSGSKQGCGGWDGGRGDGVDLRNFKIK